MLIIADDIHDSYAVILANTSEHLPYGGYGGGVNKRGKPSGRIVSIMLNTVTG